MTPEVMSEYVEPQVNGPGRGPGGEPEVPPVPSTVEETGLSGPFLSNLILKTIYSQGPRSGDDLTKFLKLPFTLLDDLLMDLQQRHLLEVRETRGQGRRGYVYDLTSSGRERGGELMESAPYVGPAPVPVNQYWRWVDLQRIRDHQLTPADIREGFSHLVLPDGLMDALGPAVNSGASLFLYGPAGNGKTSLAEAIADMFGGEIYIPRTVEIEGQIVQLFDPFFHELLEEEGEEMPRSEIVRSVPDHDERYVRIRRPVVIVGGELTLDQLELQYDEAMGVFRAPPQVKANGGVFVIDDFGRQIVRPRDLLNRWMYPLERHVDYLSLPTGQKLAVPFECLLIFATNLDPTDLVEEAFLRRIRYKILVDNPDRDQYEEIFRGMCQDRDLEFRREVVDHVWDRFYEQGSFEPRSCHPRDLLRHLSDLSTYRNEPVRFTRDTLEEACRSYFLDMSGEDAGPEDEQWETAHG